MNTMCSRKCERPCPCTGSEKDLEGGSEEIRVSLIRQAGEGRWVKSFGAARLKALASCRARGEDKGEGGSAEGACVVVREVARSSPDADGHGAGRLLGAAAVAVGLLPRTAFGPLLVLFSVVRGPVLHLRTHSPFANATAVT